MTDLDREVRKRVDAWARGDAGGGDAVAEASRIALFAAVPEMRRSHDTVRRAPSSASPSAAGAGTRRATRLHEVCFIVAAVLGLVVPGLVALSPRSGSSALSLDVGVLPAGLCAVAALGLFLWLEPYRRSSAFFAGHNAPPRLYLVYGIVWTLLAASIVVLRWDEVDEPAPVVIGLVLMLGAAAGTVPLWVRARRADAVADSGTPEAEDADMSDWWRDVDGVLTPQERESVDSAFGSALRRLQERRMLTAEAAEAARARGPRAAWQALRS